MDELPLPIEEYSGKVAEVKIGATRNEGGTRDFALVIGGDRVLPLYFFEGSNPNPPVIALEVYDSHESLPRPVKAFYSDELVENPVEWSRYVVEKLGAKMLNVKLVSVYPETRDEEPRKAAELVEEILQEVKVPLMVSGIEELWGPREVKKNIETLCEVAERTSGERVLLNPVTLDAYETVARSCIEHRHCLIAKTNMDVSQAIKLNGLLLDRGLTPERIVIDVTTGPLGYGIEYTYSTMERLRLRALKGDKSVQCPLVMFPSESWSAREISEKKGIDEMEKLGVAFEVVTAVTGILSGGNLLSILHPKTLNVVREFINEFLGQPRISINLKEWMKNAEW